jgi:hypothetical protein
MTEAWEPLPEVLASSFPNFTCYLLREMGLADTPTKQQISVCDWMQNGPSRSLTVAFRGLGKSILASFYALWRLRVDPNEKILVVSATAVKSTDFSSFMLKCIGEVDLLHCLAPGATNRYSNVAFDVGPAQVEQSPSVRSMGIMGQTTGQRCTCAILDDVETLANVITQLKQERVAHAVGEIESILKPDEGQVLPRKVLYLGTPHTETSIYLRLVRERGYKARYWPALYPEELDCYDGNLDPAILQELSDDPALVNEPTDPERFSHEDILQRQASMTRASFLLQFLLNTRLATLDKFPIRLGDLVVMDIDGSALPETVVWSNQPDVRLNELVCVGMGADHFYHRPIFYNGWITRAETWRCVLSVDPAGRGADELAWAVVAELNGNLFLLESGGSTLGYADEVLQHLARVAKKWEVNYVVAESNMGDGMFSALLKPHLLREHPVTIEEVRHNQRKEVRLCDTLGPLVQQHRLVVTTAVIKQDYRMTEEDPESGYNRSLMFQMSRLTPEKGCLSFDDRLDAVAIACAFFVEAAAQDQQKAQISRAQMLQDEAMEAWMDESGALVDQLALGMRPRASSRSQGGISRLRVGDPVRR